MGKITAIHAPHVPQYAARQAAVVAAGLSRHDAGEHHLEELPRRGAKPVDFDANRYINWRFFWDYSGGNVYENMCHQLSFWYKVMDLQDSAAPSPWSAASICGRTAAKCRTP